MYYFIAIILFLAAGVFFDNFSPMYCYNPNDLDGSICTNWSIFWFSFCYGGYLLIALTRLVHTHDRVERGYMIAGGLLLFACIIRELSYLNMDYETYAMGINSNVSKIVGTVFLTVSSIAITVDLIVRKRRKIKSVLTNYLKSWVKKLKKV